MSPRAVRSPSPRRGDGRIHGVEPIRPVLRHVQGESSDTPETYARKSMESSSRRRAATRPGRTCRCRSRPTSASAVSTNLAGLRVVHSPPGGLRTCRVQRGIDAGTAVGRAVVRRDRNRHGRRTANSPSTTVGVACATPPTPTSATCGGRSRRQKVRSMSARLLTVMLPGCSRRLVRRPALARFTRSVNAP